MKETIFKEVKPGQFFTFTDDADYDSYGYIKINPHSLYRIDDSAKAQLWFVWFTGKDQDVPVTVYDNETEFAAQRRKK